MDLLGQQRQPKVILSILVVHWMVALGEVVEEFHLLAVPTNDGNSLTSFLSHTCSMANIGEFVMILHSLISLIFLFKQNLIRKIIKVMQI